MGIREFLKRLSLHASLHSAYTTPLDKARPLVNGIDVAEVSITDWSTSLADVQAQGLRVLWAEPLSPARRRWVIGVEGAEVSE